MPSPDAILRTLASVAQQQQPIAVAWHVVLALAIAAWVLGFRPRRRVVSAFLVLPLASVSVFAWWYANPFNALVFLALGLLLAIDALSRTGAPARDASRPAVWIGGVLLAFAGIYPHFLDASRAAWVYLYASPLGLIPCPTLSAVIGVCLIGAGPVRRRSAVLVALSGLFYGLFGVLRLGVWIDVVLLAGALAFLLFTLRSDKPSPAQSRELAQARS